MQELSAQQYVQDHRPRSWSRSTVADGRWMQDKTFTPLNGNDEQLGIYIDELVKGLNTEETTRANADEAEAAARLAYDGILSGRCDFLYTSATQIRNDLTKESEDRVAGDEATLNAANSYTDTASAYVFGHANDASAHALAEAKTYANGASAYLNGRINGVSSTFNSFSADLKLWKDGVEEWEGGIDTWKSGINTWRNDTVDPKLTSLQEQIDTFEQATDVADVVSTSGDLDGYNKTLTKGAIIKVLSAGPNNDQQYYYKNKLTKTSAGPFHIDNFEVLGSVQPYYSKSEIDSNYYKKTETYTKTEVDNYLKWKVDANTAQNFTLPQQWQARQNIGASDGKIKWIQPDGQTMKTTSADLSITKAISTDNYYRLRANDGTTEQDWVLVPEPAAGQNNYLLTVLPTGIGWKAPSAELPTVTRPGDVGKALVVDSEGLKWEDRGNGYYFVNLKNTNANTFTAVKAAASAHKTIIGYEEDTNASDGRKAYKYFTFAGEYWDQYAFFDSNSNELQEKRRLWSAGNVSAYNQRFLYTSEQNLQLSEQVHVRENIDAARAPLIIGMSDDTRTLSDTEIQDLKRAVDNSTDYYTPLIYIFMSVGSTSRLYRYTLRRAGTYDKFVFESVDDQDISYIEVDTYTKIAKRTDKLIFWDNNYLPNFSSNQQTYYII